MRRLLPVVCLLQLSPVSVWAYSEDTHEQVTREALGRAQALDVARHAPEPAALGRFRAYLYDLLAKEPAFAARYPTLDGFDAWALKEFLGLSPEAAVFGVDVLPDRPESETARELIARSARHPDEDRRNQGRFAHDARRQVLLDSAGQPIPDDPATLDMGALTGLSSQAHAHYQLLPGAKSDAPAVLWRDPARFAVPPDAHTFGAVYARRFFALSALARAWPDPAGPYLSDLLFGHALHYVQDVANQIHTVQVGIFEFFVDAQLESFEEELLSLGGLLRPRPSFRAIGIGIIQNHHVLAENLFAKRLREAGGDGAGPGAAALAAMRAGEGDCEAALAATLRAGPRGLDLWEAPAHTVSLLVERSAPEGPQIYRLARRVGVRRLSRAGFQLTGADDPDAFVRPGPRAQANLEALYALETRGIARAGTATLLLWRFLDASAATLEPADLARKLAQDALQQLADAARRRARYEPHPARERVSWAVPVGLVAVLAGLVLAGRSVSRATAKRRR